MDLLRTAIILTVICGAVLYMGTFDYETELAEERIYRDNVCNGTHPDYKRLDPSC
jgi:hypothetical protein